MKVTGAPRHAPIAAPATVRYPKPAMSFREALAGDAPIASSHHAISFDGAGLLGVGKGDDIGIASTPATSADDLQAEASMPLSSAAIESTQGEGSSRPVLVSAPATEPADGSNTPRLDFRAEPARRRLGLDVSPAGMAAAGWPMPAAARIPLDSALAGPARLSSASALQSFVLAKTGHALTPAETPEAPEKESVEHTDTDASAPQADSASEVVSVIVSDDGGDIQIVAAVPDLSDETRQEVRRAAEDIARATGISISGFSLNGTALIHKNEPDRRTSWRSHL